MTYEKYLNEEGEIDEELVRAELQTPAEDRRTGGARQRNGWKQSLTISTGNAD